MRTHPVLYDCLHVETLDSASSYYLYYCLCFIEVVSRLTLGQGAGAESEAAVVARREVREGIDPETDHALVNVIHPGSLQGRRKRRSQAKGEMVSGESQSVDTVYAYVDVCLHVHVHITVVFSIFKRKLCARSCTR